jgi:hypothetical protein
MLVESGVMRPEPFLAFLCCASKFAILLAVRIVFSCERGAILPEVMCTLPDIRAASIEHLRLTAAVYYLLSRY